MLIDKDMITNAIEQMVKSGVRLEDIQLHVPVLFMEFGQYKIPVVIDPTIKPDSWYLKMPTPETKQTTGHLPWSWE